jgi:hypothetical protein
MKEVPGFVNAPFSEEQIRSINRFQLDGRLQPLICTCGGKYYAREDGLICGGCHNTTEIAPKLTTNWAWNKLKYPKQEDE